MSDAFAQAAAEAEAELSGSETVEETVTVEEGLDQSNTQGATEEPETPEPQVEAATEEPWWSQHLDDDIEVGGQKIKVRDLEGHVLRQADYTRKTQELAAERQYAAWGRKVQDALKKDPVEALKQMATELGLLDDTQEDFRPDEIDPALVQLHEVRQEVQTLKQEQMFLAIQREIAQAARDHADFDEEQVLALVAEAGGRGIPLSIEEGYFLWKGRSSTEREQAAARAKVKADGEAERLAAARTQATSVASGHSSAANTEEQRDYRKSSLRDIFDETATELGFKFD